MNDYFFNIDQELISKKHFCSDVISMEQENGTKINEYNFIISDKNNFMEHVFSNEKLKKK